MNENELPVIRTAWDDKQVEMAVDSAIAAKTTKVRRSSMKLGPYNGFSGEARVTADHKIKVALALGLIPPASECSVCGNTSGRIDYHAEDYSRPLLVAPICQGCHLSLHNRLRGAGYAESWRRRIQGLGDGTRWFEAIA